MAGAVAWTAPVLMDSVLSPAAAQSGGGPGPGPSFSYTEDFDGVPNGTGGLHSATFEPGGLTGTPDFVVTGSNVDGVEVPFFDSGPFTGTASSDHGHRARGDRRRWVRWHSGHARAPRADVHARASATWPAPARLHGGHHRFPTDTVTPASINTLYTYTQVFTTSGRTTITIADTGTSNQGVFIGDFSVTG